MEENIKEMAEQADEHFKRGDELCKKGTWESLSEAVKVYDRAIEIGEQLPQGQS